MSVRSSALANTYQVPLMQQPEAAPQPKFQDEIGEAEEGLQNVDGVTSQYYEKWAALKGFARDVWENYGIDVRYPDPSVPESNRLNRIYLKSIADLKGQGNKLKTSQQMFSAALARKDIIKGDPKTTMFADMQNGTDYINSDLDQIVTQTNDKLQQQYYDAKSLGEAKKIYEDTKGLFLDNAKEDPQNAEYWMRQAQGLTAPTSATKQFAERAPASQKDNDKVDAGGAFLKKIENIRTGNSDHYKLDPKSIDENGDPMYVSNDMMGDNWSDTESVVRWEHSPNMNQTWLVVKDKNTGNQRKVDVSAEDGMSVSKAFTSNNTRYASDGEYLDRYAQQNKLFKGEGGLDNSSLLVSDHQDRYNRRLAEVGKHKTKGQIKQLGTELEKLEPGFFGLRDARTTKYSSDGQPIDIVKRADGWEIENMKSLVPAEEYEKYKKNKIMTKQALLKFLAKRGVLEGAAEATETPQAAPVTTGTKAAPSKGKAVSMATIKSKVGTPGFEGYSEQELIDYYAGQGFTIK
jgi:hypothetical protein